MDWADLLISAAKYLATAIIPAAFTWWLMRPKTDAETSKLQAEAKLTSANADRVVVENDVNRIVAKSLGEVKAILNEHGTAIVRLEAGMNGITHEVTTNHGSSIKDAVIRLEAGQAALATQLSVLDGGRLTNQMAIQAIQQQMTRIEDKLDPMAEDYRRALADHIEIEQRLRALEN